MKNNMYRSFKAWAVAHDQSVRKSLSIFAAIAVVTAVAMLVLQYQGRASDRHKMAESALQDKKQHAVLFISSYSQSHFSVPLQWNGLSSAFKNSDIILDTEYMDTKNHADPKSQALFETMLRNKLRNFKYDVLVVGDDPALNFAEDHRKDIFQNIPVVFLGINDILHAESVHRAGWATGVPEQSNMEDTFHLACDLFPECDVFTIIVDDSPTGRGDVQTLLEFEKNFTDKGKKFEIVNISELKKDEFIKRMKELPENHIVFELDAFFDAEKNVYTIDDICRLLAEYCPRPVFRASTGGVGNGALGSGFLDFELFGKTAGKMVLSIINGESVADIPLAYNTKTGYVFDYEQMQRFNVDRDSLPENTTVLNYEQTLWEQYTGIFIPIILIILATVAFIVSLFVAKWRTERDKEDLDRNNIELDRRVYYDILTELPNRRYIKEKITDEQLKSIKSVCVLDVDGFKFINEKYGHDGGDTVLKTIADRLRQFPENISARIGADDFLICFSNDITRCKEKCNQLDILLNRPVNYHGDDIAFTCSIGYAVRCGIEQLDDLMTEASVAKFNAKKNGFRHMSAIYSDEEGKMFDRRAKMEQDITRAIREESFEVVYQPKVITSQKSIGGFEALCRFKDNLYYPGEFIPAAEANGLIIYIDRIMTRKVVEQMRRWKNEGFELPVISINYSAVQLQDEDYCDFLQELLDRNDIPHDRIQIEITESQSFGHNSASRAFFDKVQSMGMHLALDDFGNGYSTIGALNSFPVKYVKLDKSVNDTYLQEGKESYIKHIVDLAHDLGKSLVAEGVETEVQFRLARQLGIDQIQGYYFSRPLPPDEAIRWKPNDD